MQTKVKLILIVVVVVVIAGAGLLTLILSSARPSSAPTDMASNGKLNIDAVCQGALAYMTFPSNVEAEAFVKDCKEGKHPEVIEKYKADNGFGDGTVI